MPENFPDDPVSQLAEGAVQLHVLFNAWVQAGFSREEALHMITAILVEAMGNSQ